MNCWMKDHEWRKKVPNQNIYLMRDHNYAFSAWEIARMKAILKPYAIMIHVDSHLDDVSDAIDVPGVLGDIQSFDKAIQLAKKFDYGTGESPNHVYMWIDSFIWPSVVRNTIGDIIYVCDENKKELNENSIRDCINRDTPTDNHHSKIILENLMEQNKSIRRFHSLEEFQSGKGELLLEDTNRSLILDLDLDYFVKSYNTYQELYDREQITNNLEYLKRLADWDVITVALSPEYCGGEEHCKYLLDLFASTFNIEMNELLSW
ncbi:hypothetical protein J32TS6_04880 [Virgibacillus pantothenticus]|uniref:Uncharacterized protein n=1 Tax=Virgibacillus pantothenticus TaxID=1473 RepID=A0A0L0QM54_VIRPA|nr:UPF0489 family protein [Virgibacillus pantothenticus]KNE19677.1 hypothetical protein AFK71_14575 [Virgibacillus pantothenticus]MED3735889.1 UPF0489 family protein [Virgibacillus pantothenticus]QTY14793.1 UPF0489 family protein [Virgibacillus pantothenticus]SIT17581.1 UPF0489 domain-containing protein [Virgibacillus pantothenticus]GIP61933.1 hypothetical protein J32TS6_04880 [Virgibacillus pantothenticus]